MQRRPAVAWSIPGQCVQGKYCSSAWRNPYQVNLIWDVAALALLFSVEEGMLGAFPYGREKKVMDGSNRLWRAMFS